MFLWPLVTKKVPKLKIFPSPLIVLLVAIPMGMAFDLMHPHSYTLQNHEYQLGENYLVAMPDRVFGMFDSITGPDFSALRQPMAWKWVAMFFLIGSLESLLSAKAVDIIDPWRRKSSMDRDMVAVGAGNLCCAFVGGLPMISEIVRSKANIDAGARTRFADFWHGMLLLVCVAFIPMVLHLIPMAALAAMLIYTGFRLAHPSEFMSVWRIGREQLVIFTVTMIAVLATDLLVGIAIGIATKFIIHLTNGVSFESLFFPSVEVVNETGDTINMKASKSMVFSNWISIRRQIERAGLLERKNVQLDVSETKLIDHSVMDKLHELENDFEQQGLHFDVTGLEGHRPFDDHAQSARRQGLHTVQRLTIITEPELEGTIHQELVRLGATGFTSVTCSGVGRQQLQVNATAPLNQIRIEAIAPKETSLLVIDYLRREVEPRYRMTFCVETVQVSKLVDFVPVEPLASGHGSSPSSVEVGKH